MFRDTFFENVILILLTSTLTGLLVPIIKSGMDQRKYREQKIFEQDLARQSKRIESQSKMLEELNEALWGFQLLSLEPAHFRLQGNTSSGELASEKYNEEAVALLNRIRAEIGRARSLTSPDIHRKLLDLYRQLLETVDPWLKRLEKDNSATTKDWDNYQTYLVNDLVVQIEDLINLLAWDIGIASASSLKTIL